MTLSSQKTDSVTNRRILAIAVPSILASVSTPLMGSVDTALMGNISAIHLGAIGLGSQIFDFIYWNFGFLRMATTGLTAQASGARDEGEASAVMMRALVMALALAVVLVVLQRPIENAGIWLLGAEPEHRAYIREYVSIRIWAAPATLGIYVGVGWLLGMSRAKSVLVLTILGNVINIAVSYSLVAYWNLGVAGVAWGTLVAQYTVLLLGLGLCLRHPSFRWPTWARVRNLSGLGPTLRLQRDIFLRTLALNLSFGLFNNRSASLGSITLAANVVVMKLVLWMAYAVDGFALAAEVIVGNAEGADDRKGRSRAVRLSFVWGLCISAVFAGVYLFGAPSIVDLFTQDLVVIEQALDVRLWLVALPVIGAIAYLWDGIFIGLGAGVAMRNSMLASMAVFAGAVWLLMPVWGNHGLWAAFGLFLLTRSVTQGLLYLRL